MSDARPEVLDLSRRQSLTATAVGVGLLAAGGCRRASSVRGADAILDVAALGAQWPTLDPFLFCAHHDDAYPAGNRQLGPAATLADRDLGQDFASARAWRMYHGLTVPGFPQHPHRGFETVTVTLRGTIDHADSLGATARYGGGDVQWLTAGAGIAHAEMFPLIAANAPNPLELFQIWLNLPARNKFARPHFSMFWRESLGTHVYDDHARRRTTVKVIAGGLGEAKAPPPPPDSWASHSDAAVCIWTIKMARGARFTLPAHSPGLNRALYVHRGGGVSVGLAPVAVGTRVVLRSDQDVDLTNGDEDSQLLFLQGRPIAEPVVQHGPFVMNSRAEIQQAIADYRATGFGGWPWSRNDPVHPATSGRFAVHADGRRERAGT